MTLSALFLGAPGRLLSLLPALEVSLLGAMAAGDEVEVTVSIRRGGGGGGGGGGKNNKKEKKKKKRKRKKKKKRRRKGR